MKILNTIGDAFTPEAKQILQGLGEVEYRIPSQKALSNRIGEYGGIVAGLGLVFSREILENAKKLRVIATATTGLDHIDMEFAKEKGIEVLSLRGENEFLDTITGTAELAWGLALSLSRSLPWAFDSVKSGEWNREEWRGHTLYGKTLGIVGLGRLGKMVARFGEAFGMKVLFTDPSVEARLCPQYTKVELSELLSQSDVVSLHVHLTKETEHLIEKEALKKMKPGAILVNTSRGNIVNETDILQALEAGKLGGYGADVLSGELQFSSGSLEKNSLVEYAKKAENVMIVPHIGGMTVESRASTDVFIAEKLKKFLNAGL